MKFRDKEIKLKIVDDALDSYEELNKIIGEERLKGITNSTNQTLFNAIKQKIKFLKENPEYGTHIQKNRIPKFYFKIYGVNNLWKVNLPKAWRMIYTIRGTEVEVISLILDIFNHRDYEKKFKYRKT